MVTRNVRMVTFEMEDTEEDRLTPSTFCAGLYGWRKRCLYCLLFLLLVLVTINLALIVWITKVLKITFSEGVAGLYDVEGGIELTGQALVLDTLISTKVFTHLGQSLQVQSNENITLMSKHSRVRTSSFVLGKNGMDLYTNKFRVKDPRGKTLFFVNKDELTLTSDYLHIHDEGGSLLDGTLYTPRITGKYRSDLKLDSRTKSIHAVTAANVLMDSYVGAMKFTSNSDLKLVTVDAAIKLESPYVFFPCLKHPNVTRRHRRHKLKLRKHKLIPKPPPIPQTIYQLCMCREGDLFLGDADKPCETAHCL